MTSWWPAGTVRAGSLLFGWLFVQIEARDRRHLLEWTSDLRLLDATEFEWLVGELLRREGWSVAEHGRQAGPDGNIDLEIRLASGGGRSREGDDPLGSGRFVARGPCDHPGPRCDAASSGDRAARPAWSAGSGRQTGGAWSDPDARFHFLRFLSDPNVGDGVATPSPSHGAARDRGRCGCPGSQQAGGPGSRCGSGQREVLSQGCGRCGSIFLFGRLGRALGAVGHTYLA